MTIEQQVHNDKGESFKPSDRVDANPDLCLASLAGDRNAFNNMGNSAQTASDHLPGLSIDFGDGDGKNDLAHGSSRGGDQAHKDGGNENDRGVSGNDLSHSGEHHEGASAEGPGGHNRRGQETTTTTTTTSSDASVTATSGDAASAAPSASGDTSAAATTQSDTSIASTTPSAPSDSSIVNTAPSTPTDTAVGLGSAPSTPTDTEVGVGSAPSIPTDTAVGLGSTTSASSDTVSGAASSAPSDNIAAAATTTAGAGTVDGIEIGVDGHSDWYGSSYDNLSAQQTIDSVKNMGLGTYSFDVIDGNPKTQQLIDAANRDGVQLMGSIGDSPSSFANAQDAYNTSFSEAAALGAEYGSGIKTWQLANETDAFAMSSPQNFQIVESEMQGLTAGLKSTDPSAETMINSTNAATGGEFLKQLQADGVNWDVTGYHAYTQSGDVANSGETTLADDAALGKPIYVSELNGWNSGDQGPGQIAGNAQLMLNSLDSIRSVAQQDDIIGANFYELLDQPEISGSEGGYGILNADGSATATSNAITSYMQANGNS